MERSALPRTTKPLTRDGRVALYRLMPSICVGFRMKKSQRGFCRLALLAMRAA